MRPGQIGEDDRKNMLRGLNGLKNPVGQRRIQSDDQQGIPAPFFTGTLHAGDINLVITEHPADGSDDAGFVDIENQQHMSFGNHFHLEIIDLNDPRFFLMEEGAGQAMSLFPGFDPHANHTDEISGIATLDFLHLDAALLGDDRRIDVIDGIFEKRREQPFSDCKRKRGNG